MKGPEKVRWLKYYIIQPAESLFGRLDEAISTSWIKLKGGWYCEYCGKIHCRRVYKYKLVFYSTASVNVSNTVGTLRDISDESGRFVCSLGRDAVLNESWKPQNITLGDKLQSSFELAGKAFGGTENDNM